MSITILVDSSGSMRELITDNCTRLKAVWQAVRQSELWNGDEKVYVSPFSDTIHYQSPIQLKSHEQVVQLGRDSNPHGNTLLWDCVFEVLKTIYEKNSSLIVYTDGEDTRSKHSYEEVQQEALERGVKLSIIIIGDEQTTIPDAKNIATVEEINQILLEKKIPEISLKMEPTLSQISPVVFNLDPNATEQNVQTVSDSIRKHHAYLEQLTGLTYHPVPTFLVEHAVIERFVPVKPEFVPPIDLADIWEFERFLSGVCMFVHQPHRLEAESDRYLPQKFITRDSYESSDFFADFGNIPLGFRYKVLWELSEWVYGLGHLLFKYGYDAGLQQYLKQNENRDIYKDLDSWLKHSFIPKYSAWMKPEEASQKMFEDMAKTLKDVVKKMPEPFFATSPNDFKGLSWLNQFYPQNRTLSDEVRDRIITKSLYRVEGFDEEVQCAMGPLNGFFEDSNHCGPNLEIWERHLSKKDFDKLLNCIGNDGQWNLELSSIVEILPIAIETTFRLMTQFRQSSSSTLKVSRNLDAWGIYTPNLSNIPEIARLLNNPKFGGVLISLQQLREDCSSWLENEGKNQEQALIEMLIVHEHTHAIVKEGLEKNGCTAWQKQDTTKHKNHYHAVSESLAEWSTLERFRNNRALSKLICEHIESGKLPDWPYNAAKFIENFPLPLQKFRAIMGYFQKDFQIAWKALKD